MSRLRDTWFWNWYIIKSFFGFDNIWTDIAIDRSSVKRALFILSFTAYLKFIIAVGFVSLTPFHSDLYFNFGNGKLKIFRSCLILFKHGWIFWNLRSLLKIHRVFTWTCSQRYITLNRYWHLSSYSLPRVLLYLRILRHEIKIFSFLHTDLCLFSHWSLQFHAIILQIILGGLGFILDHIIINIVCFFSLLNDFLYLLASFTVPIEDSTGMHGLETLPLRLKAILLLPRDVLISSLLQLFDIVLIVRFNLIVMIILFIVLRLAHDVGSEVFVLFIDRGRLPSVCVRNKKFLSLLSLKII